MRMKQKVGGLRERDMELARTLETKMNTYADMMEELGVQYKLPERHGAGQDTGDQDEHLCRHDGGTWSSV